jgi:hypothetical protein
VDMNTLTSRDVRAMLDALARISELTSLLRGAHYGVHVGTVYHAAAAVDIIRDKLLAASITDIAVEAAPMAIAAE